MGIASLVEHLVAVDEMLKVLIHTTSVSGKGLDEVENTCQVYKLRSRMSIAMSGNQKRALELGGEMTSPASGSPTPTDDQHLDMDTMDGNIGCPHLQVPRISLQ